VIHLETKAYLSLLYKVGSLVCGVFEPLQLKALLGGVPAAVEDDLHLVQISSDCIVHLGHVASFVDNVFALHIHNFDIVRAAREDTFLHFQVQEINFDEISRRCCQRVSFVSIVGVVSGVVW